MKLGFAVKVLGEGGLPTHEVRRWQSGPHLRWSIEVLHGVFDYLEAKAKDLAMLRLRDQLGARGLDTGRDTGTALTAEPR